MKKVLLAVLFLAISISVAYASKSAEEYVLSGDAYGLKGDYNRAIDDLTKAIQLKPDYAEAYYFRGLVYGIKGQYSMKSYDLRKACDMGFKEACEELKKH